VAKDESAGVCAVGDLTRWFRGGIRRMHDGAIMRTADAPLNFSISPLLAADTGQNGIHRQV